MKKIIALILAFALMLGAMPFAFAAEHVHDGDCCGAMPARGPGDCICPYPTPGYRHEVDPETGIMYPVPYCMVCGGKLY